MNLELLSTKVIQIKNFIVEQPISLLLYIPALLLYIFIGSNNPLFVISIAMFIIAVFYDTIRFFQFSHGKFWEKFVFLAMTVIAYFSFIQAESFAQTNIYIATEIQNAPLLFKLAFSYLVGIYFITSVILTSITILSIFSVVLLLSLYVPMIASMFGVKNETQNIFIKTWVHIFLYTSSSAILMFSFLDNHTKIHESVLGKNYIHSKVINYSFIPNRTCSNIPKDSPILFLKNNNILTTNVEQFYLLGIPSDMNITYEQEICKKEKKL